MSTSDFIYYWPFSEITPLNDFLWGGIAVAIYLWAAKRRKAKRASALQAKANSDATGPQAGVWPPAGGNFAAFLAEAVLPAIIQYHAHPKRTSR